MATGVQGCSSKSQKVRTCTLLLQAIKFYTIYCTVLDAIAQNSDTVPDLVSGYIQSEGIHIIHRQPGNAKINV